MTTTEIKYSYPKTVSWKRSSQDGSKGVGSLRAYVQPCGVVTLIARETPESFRGGKEVHLDLSDEAAKQLRDMLNARYPQ